MTGEWFYETKQLRHQDRIHGTDIIRASMKQAQRPLTTRESVIVREERRNGCWMSLTETLSKLTAVPKSRSWNKSCNKRNPWSNGRFVCCSGADAGVLWKAPCGQLWKWRSFCPPCCLQHPSGGSWATQQWKVSTHISPASLVKLYAFILKGTDTFDALSLQMSTVLCHNTTY